MEIFIGILISFGLVAYVLSKTKTPVYLDNENKPITSQDGLENVITDEKTIHVKKHSKDRSKEIIIDTPISTPFDEPINYDFKNTKGGRQLTEHIAKVIELNPNSKKRLTKRKSKIIDEV